MKYLYLSFLLFFYIPSHATLVKGVVTDEQGNTIGFVTIAQKNSTNATSANAKGYYEIDVPQGNQVIECSLMGYKTSSKTIQVGTESITLNFQLSVQQYDIDEVVITNSEGPAYEIMRKVIANRKAHAALIKSLETDIYLKGLLKLRAVPTSFMGVKLDDSVKQEMGLNPNGSGIVYLLEELSHYTYKAPKKEFNEVIKVRESGNPQGLGFASMPPIINIYNNNITILDGLNDRGFISPANSNAFFYYKYKFMGSYFEGDKMINKIKVIPKRKYEPLFSGYVYVVENDWAFKAVNLTLTQESQMSKLDTLRLNQNYTNIKDNIWIIQNQILYPTLKIFGFDVTGNFVTVYQKQKLNQNINDNIFSNRTIATYDSNATNYTHTFWDTARPIPLEKEEIDHYHISDSTYLADLHKEDSLKNKPRYKIGLSNFILSGAEIRKGKNTFQLNSLIELLNYNTVEGLNISPTLRWHHQYSSSKSLDVTFTNRYGFSNTHYNPLFSVQFHSNDSTHLMKRTTLSLSIGNKVNQLNNSNPISPQLNYIYTLLSGNNYMKLYETRLVKLNINHSLGNGLSTAFYTSFEDRSALYNTSTYTFTKDNEKNLTPNQPVTLPTFENHKAFIIHAAIKYQPGWKYIQYPKYKMPIPGNAPIFTLSYTKGIPKVFNSKSDFDKWSFSISHNINMRLLGSLEYRLQTGGFLNKKYVGLPDMIHINGNQTIFSTPYLNSFQLASYYSYSHTADLYFNGHAQWHLNGWLSNKIPLFKRLNWFFVAGASTLYINKNDNYSELSFGIENIGWKLFRYIRVDFIAGYDSHKASPVYGCRIGLGDLLKIFTKNEIVIK